MPYLWDSYFIQEELKEKKIKKEDIFYSAHNGKPARRVSIFEPNTSFIKNCLVPVKICERAFVKHKTNLESLNIFNCKAIRQNKVFMRLLNRLKVVHQGHAYFNNRWNTLDALARWQGVVVSHQILNDLNYLHLECLYLGVPLIHNSVALQDAGYFYENFNIDDGALQLKVALECHQQNFDYYRGQTRTHLARYAPHNPQNITAYKNLILKS